jgi:hypothetical protein
MERAYLEEDLRLIHKYFPGAQPVALRTPFDIRVSGGQRPGLQPDAQRPTKRDRWFGDLVWEQA